MTSAHHGHKGFTLVEILISLAITAIVMTGIFSTFNTQSKTFNAQQQVTEMQQNARAAMDIMTHDIRMAGYSSVEGVTFANSTSILFKQGNDSVAYRRYSGARLGKIINGGPSQAVAENIQALSFTYQNYSGTIISTPLVNIRRILFSIIARTAVPDPMYSDNGGYRTYSLTTNVVRRNK